MDQVGDLRRSSPLIAYQKTPERGIHAPDAPGLFGGLGAAALLPALSGGLEESGQQEGVVGANAQLFQYVHRAPSVEVILRMIAHGFEKQLCPTYD